MTVRAEEAMIDRSPEPEVFTMARKAQHSLDYSCDLYLGELARRSRTEATRRKYRDVLEPFCAMYEHLTPRDVRADHCRVYLDRWADASASTLALYVSVLRGFFEFLRDERIVDVSPMDRIKRPRRLRPEDVDVVSVSTDEVVRIFNHCETWQELLCIAVLIYLGARRNAVSMLRRRDVDLEQGLMRFREKGRKVVWKPIPDELLDILRAADEELVWAGPDDYLVPNRRPSTVRRPERANKVIYETVVKVAKRAGVRTHVHALRAAFAVAFDEAHPDQVIALKELLGHARIETTLVYLRRKDRAAAMENVRDLSWSSRFRSDQQYPQRDSNPRSRRTVDTTGLPVTDGDRAVDALLARVRQLSIDAKQKGRVES